MAGKAAMPRGSGTTESVWMDVQPQAKAKRGSRLQADVCVVGAGMAGLSTAYQLSRAGRSVLVVDDSGIASGETARTTAHLTNAIDDRIYEIERWHGPTGARLALESHGDAIDTIDSIQRRERIDCDFQRLDGYLFLQDDDEPENLGKELDAAHRAGFADVERVARAPLRHFDTGPALRFPRQGQFHPLRYLQGLCQAIERKNGAFFVEGHADSVEDGETTQVRLDNGTHIAADATVVCTNVPVTSRVVFHTKQSPYRTFALGFPVRRGAIERNLYWDTLFPYHYVRLQDHPHDPEREILIVGGQDVRPGHETRNDREWNRLEGWARDRFPIVREVTHRWSGQFLQTPDGLAYLGAYPLQKNVYVITGDSGMGMTHATIGSLIVRDQILGKKNPWADLYDPSRKPIRAPGEFVKEALAMTKKYARLVTAGDVRTVDKIRAGQGAVVAEGLRKVAYYRDEAGRLSACSAICTHLGCVVAWNASENSWDCPCHGSRFDPYGTVVNGPANKDLKPLRPGRKSPGSQRARRRADRRPRRTRVERPPTSTPRTRRLAR